MSEYRFGNIRERDIDVLLLYSFVTDELFLDLFTSKIGHTFDQCRVVEAELSKTHPVWGESDVTVIFESLGKRYALLIEDKVGAEAQPEQCSRYYRRGEIGVADKEYDEFYLFICGAANYIENNEEANKYPYSISFEELAAYFSGKQDSYGKVRYEEIMQALSLSKAPYKKIIDATATEFWKGYTAYLHQHFPDLQLLNGTREKSRSGDWPVYYTQLNYNKKVYIQHKMDKGIIDLTFNDMAFRQKELGDFLQLHIGDYQSMGLEIRPAGKSAVLRKDLGADNGLSFQKSFESQVDAAQKHFEALYQLHLIAASLNYNEVVNLISKKTDK